MNYYSSFWAPSDYLMHHGILGQKWGVRRYQNADGTLTSAGKRRYGTDLDISDKSRKNVADIRLGEARRRLDIAKANNPTNKTRIAQLQGRVRSAKQARRHASKYDKGAALAAKGQTITGNSFRVSAVTLGTKAARTVLSKIAQDAMRNSFNANNGAYIAGKGKAAGYLATYGSLALAAISVGYSIKKGMDNRNLRYYNRQVYSSKSTLRGVGGEEYRDVVERRKNNSN